MKAKPATNERVAQERQRSRVDTLSADLVISLHERIILRSGGASGILNRGTLEAAIERAVEGPFEHDGDPMERAAHLLRGIGQDHPFVDGNKRTALEAADTLLRAFGFHISASTDETIAFMLSVAQVQLDLDGMTAWLRNHSRLVPAHTKD